MHDDEPDTFRYETWPERLSGMLAGIGVDSEPVDGPDEVESGDYYSRYVSRAPRMVTGLGCVGVRGSNIDLVQIIQKG